MWLIRGLRRRHCPRQLITYLNRPTLRAGKASYSRSSAPAARAMKQCGQDGSPAQRGMKYGRMMASAHWHPSSTREEAGVAGRTKQGACCCSSGKREEVRARARKRQRCHMLALHRQAQQGKSILARLRQSSNKQWWHAGVST